MINSITVNSFASLFNCTPLEGVSDYMMGRLKAMKFILWKLEAEPYRQLLDPPMVLVCYFDIQGISRNRNTWFLSSLKFIMVRFMIYLFYRDDSLTKSEIHYAGQTIN